MPHLVFIYVFLLFLFLNTPFIPWCVLNTKEKSICTTPPAAPTVDATQLFSRLSSKILVLWIQTKLRPSCK